MSFLILSNTPDLDRLKATGVLPITQSEQNNQNSMEIVVLKSGDKIFLYNGDTEKIYGYGIITGSKPSSEILSYRSKKKQKSILLRVDMRDFMKRGFKTNYISSSPGILNMISGDEEKWFLEKLWYVNRRLSSIFIAFLNDEKRNSFADGSGIFSVLIYSPGYPSGMGRVRLKIDRAFAREIFDKIKMIEDYQRRDGFNRLYDCIVELGNKIYLELFKPLNLEFLWQRGNYLIDFYIDNYNFFFPLELAYANDRFLFEKNIISFLSSNDWENCYNGRKNRVKLKKVLLLASLANGIENSLSEVDELYRFFKNQMNGKNSHVRLIARDPGYGSLRKQLFDVDIFHFSGHMANSGIKGMRDSFLFRTLLNLNPERRPRMIFLNSCGRGYRNGFQITELGVRCCITPRYKIPDTQGAGFISSFYAFLKHGFSVAYAFNRTINMEFSRRRLLPLSYSFFGDNRMSYDL